MEHQYTILEKRVKNLEKNMAIHLKVSGGELKKLRDSQSTLASRVDLQRVEGKVDGMVETVNTVADLIKNFRIGVTVGGKVMGFSGKTIVNLGGFFVAVAAVVVGIKWFFGWLGLAWLVKWLP